MIQSLLMPWLPIDILEMCHPAPGHCYSLTLQVGSSNSLVFNHLEKENSGSKLIKAQEHEGKRRYVINGERELFTIKSHLAWENVLLLAAVRNKAPAHFQQSFLSRVYKVGLMLSHRGDKLEDVISSSASPSCLTHSRESPRGGENEHTEEKIRRDR